MPRSKIDHPGDFSNKVGYDLYLNPWWALRFQQEKARALCEQMTNILGQPDLWFQGLFHELLWGPRHLDRSWRPSIHANISGGNGKTWFHLWLPWRSRYDHGYIEEYAPGKEPWREMVFGVKSEKLLINGSPVLTKIAEPRGYNGLPSRLTAETPPAYNANIIDVDVDPERDLKGLIAYSQIIKSGG